MRKNSPAYNPIFDLFVSISNKEILKSIFFSACSLFVFSAAAQPGDDLKVVSDYKPTLNDANKIEIRPVLKDPVVKKAPMLRYDISTYQYGLSPVITFAPARKMDKPLEKRLRNNFFKLGFGNNFTPLGEVYLGSTKNPKAQYGLYFRHLSSNGQKITDFADNELKAFGKKIFKKGEMGINLQYLRNNLYYYGYNTALVNEDIARDSLKNYYSTIATSLFYNGLEKGKNKSVFNAGLDYHYHESRLKNQENYFRAFGHYSFDINKNRLNIDVQDEFAQYGDSFEYYNRNLVSALATFDLKKKDYTLSVGPRLQVFTDSSGTVPYLFPVANFRYHIDGEAFDFIAEMNGQNQMRTFRQTSAFNPYIGRNAELKNSIYKFSLGAGVELKASENLSLKALVHTHRINNLPIFLTDTFSSNSFKIFYDDARLLQFQAQAQYTLSEKAWVYAGLTLNRYNMDNFNQAYQYPSLETKVGAAYTMGEKLTLKTDVFFTGARQTVLAYRGTNEIRLDPFVDLNFNADYRYKKNISVFLMVNNIASARYQRWYNYPVYSINALLGVTFSF